MIKLNLPNKLTVLRLIGTLVFLAFAMVPDPGDGSTAHQFWWRIGYIIAVLAGFTDFLDGYIARKYDLVTDFGKLMDPLADKIFTVTCFVVLTDHGYVPAWITCIILTREFAVNGLRTLAAKAGEVIQAKNIGKVKTVLQMLILAFGGCMWVDWIHLNRVTHKPLPLYWFWQGLLWSIAVLTVYSGLEYFWKGRRLYMKDS